MTLFSSDNAFVIDTLNSTIYSFDTTNPTSSTAYPQGGDPILKSITFSPDGSTVYFTNEAGDGDVTSFPANDPTSQNSLGTGIEGPFGIAISSDGSLGFVANIYNLYSFPTGGNYPHTATVLSPVEGTPTILNPVFLAINGPNAFVAVPDPGQIYSVSFTSTTYNATLIQTIASSGDGVGDLTISNDGYLYFSEGDNDNISRVSLSDPTATPTLVLSQPATGCAVSNDGTTVYFTNNTGGHGVYTCPSSGGSSTPLSGLGIPAGQSITLAPPPLTPPVNLTGNQKNNNFGLVFERVNFLQWDPSIATRVAGYSVYRDGTKIASLNASTLSYQDHNIQQGIPTFYSVTSFDSGGSESSPVNVLIN